MEHSLGGNTFHPFNIGSIWNPAPPISPPNNIEQQGPNAGWGYSGINNKGPANNQNNNSGNGN